MTDEQQPLTETQALAWLHGQPDGTIATTVSDLARSWGWNRSTSRRVKVWVASGQLVRTPARTVIPYSQQNTRCATGVRHRGRPRFPFTEISRHSNGEPACAIRCTGRTTPWSGSCSTSAA